MAGGRGGRMKLRVVVERKARIYIEREGIWISI